MANSEQERDRIAFGRKRRMLIRWMAAAFAVGETVYLTGCGTKQVDSSILKNDDSMIATRIVAEDLRRILSDNKDPNNYLAIASRQIDQLLKAEREKKMTLTIYNKDGIDRTPITIKGGKEYFGAIIFWSFTGSIEEVSAEEKARLFDKLANAARIWEEVSKTPDGQSMALAIERSLTSRGKSTTPISSSESLSPLAQEYLREIGKNK